MINKLLLCATLSLSLCKASTAQTLPANLSTDGLVGWWPFNGNANDESGNGNDGVVGGALLTNDRNDISNSAYLFDPTWNSEIVVPFSNSLNSIQNAITLSAWILMDGGTSASTPPRVLELRGSYGNGGNAGFVMLAQDNSNVSRTFEFKWHTNNDSTNLTFNPTQQLSALTWHHIIFTADGVLGNVSYYFDGVLIQTYSGQSITNCNYNNNALYIGKEPNSLGKWGGKLDDIAIYNRALSQEEITALYTGEPANPTTACNPLPSNLQNGLVGYWPFCGDANDKSGNGNDGTVNGATLTEDRFGLANAAYDFDGMDDWIEVPNSDDFTIEEWTISIWYNSTDSGLNRLSTKSPFDGSTNYLAIILADGKIYGSSSLEGNVNNPLPIDATNTNDGNWHNATYSRSGGNFSLYIDGAVVASVLDNFTALSNNSKLLFGKDPTDLEWQFLNGKIDDIGIWNRALTAEEVQELYALNACTFSIYDTTYVTIYDTVSVSTTDTLIINTLITAVQPAQENTFLVYPNPAGSQITINNGNVSILGGYTMRISNSIGQEVYNQNITQTEVTLDLSNWGGNGLYVLYILDPQQNIVAVKQIVLQ